MHRVSAVMSSGSIGREHRDPQLVATELAVRLHVDDAVRPQERGHRGRVDVVGEVDGADDLAARGWGPRRRGWCMTSRSAQPIQTRTRIGGSCGGPGQPTLRVHPVELLGEHDEGGDGWGVVGLVLARVVDGCGQAEEVGHPPSACGDLLDPGDGRRGEGREPQAAVGGEALLRREVVDVRFGHVDGQAGGARGRVDEHEGVIVGTGNPAHRRHDPGGCLVVRPGVHIDTGLGIRGGECTGVGADHGRLPEEWGVRRHRGELAGELPEGQVLGAVADQPEGRDIPECRGSAVAENDLVAVRQAQQVA
jgi:hypothetical protein